MVLLVADAPAAQAEIQLPAPPPSPAEAPVVHFGGPGKPQRALRDLLKARIEAAPPGSEILWATYYFRDRDLAQALVAAHLRGVRVRVIMEAKPRRRSANVVVARMLGAGLGDGFKQHHPPGPFPIGSLHTKIYAFSGPVPTVFVGSFNPSGDEPEDVVVTTDIGDQDRGHNLLVEFRQPEIVEAIRIRADTLWRTGGRSRFSSSQNRPLELPLTTLYFYPRLHPLVVEPTLEAVGPGDTVRGSISHMALGPLTKALSSAARRGASVRLVVHDTLRRMPERVIAKLAQAGVTIRRYCHPDGLPMHAKMLVVQDGPSRAAWFGSYNFTMGSRLINQEVLARSENPVIVAAFERRLDDIDREVAQGPSPLARQAGYLPTPVPAAMRGEACAAPAPGVPAG